MRGQPPLTFGGALKVLDKHESGVIAKLDKLLGGVILAAGAASGFAPAVLLGAIWGWVDQKNEAISLLKSLTGGLSNRLSATRGLERRELIAAAHSIIVLAAFFEIVEETLGKQERKRLTEDEQHAHATFEALYEVEIPTPSASCGFHENVLRLAGWMADLTEATNPFLFRQISGHVRTNDPFVVRTVERYTSHYLRLAERVPEFSFWAMLGEHAATREQLGRALTRVEALLERIVNRDAVVGRHRESLRNANRGVLDQPIVPHDAERYDTAVTFPTIEDAFLSPRYAIATSGRDARPADENWWQQRESDDLDLMLTAHLTSPEATRLPMLLLGHPGAGKSILTKVLAARLPAEDYTVVRVPLRAVSAGAPVLDQIQEALDLATHRRTTWQSLTDESTDAVMVVLLDGLDELLQAATFDRGSYLRDVMDFQRREAEQQHPVAVIVTSRTVVADRVAIPAGTPIVKLHDFDEPRIARWLDTWRAINAAAIAAGTVRELTVKEARHQLDLAVQPLLLLMLAVYAADPASPKLDDDLSTSALYDRIFDNFARREVQKRAQNPLHGRDLEDAVADQVTRLSVAALAMVNRGVQHVRETTLRADLAALTRKEVQDDAGRRLLGEFFFVHAAEAVLLEKERSYEFLHATFGEYLVARHVLTELADLADAAYGGRRERDLDDKVLFALLSHQAWAARASIRTFATEIYLGLPEAERRNIRRSVAELLGSYRHRQRSSELDSYRPTPLDVLRQLAAYSANLVTLAVSFHDEDDPFRLVGLFGDNEEEALRNWTATITLWRAGLDKDSARALIYLLKRRPDLTVAIRQQDRYISKEGGLEELYLADLKGYAQHANVIRQGLAVTEGLPVPIGHGRWADHMLAALNARIFHGVSADFPPTPSETPTEGLPRVARALSFYLRTWLEESEAESLFRNIPKNLPVEAGTLLLAAYHHPLHFLEMTQWHDPAHYTNFGAELHIVLDLVEEKLPPELLDAWQSLRVTLLGRKDAKRRAAVDAHLMRQVIDMLTTIT